MLMTRPAPRWVAVLPWLLSLSAHAAVLAAAVVLRLDSALRAPDVGDTGGITVLALPSDRRHGSDAPAPSTVAPASPGVAERGARLLARAGGERQVAVALTASPSQPSAASTVADKAAAPSATAVDLATGVTIPAGAQAIALAPARANDAPDRVTGLADTKQVAMRSPAADPEAAAPTSSATAAIVAVADGGPAATLAVRYLDTPAPPYPETARRAGREGLVRIRVRVDSAGVPGDLRMLQSSGWDELDAAALAGVARWRFQPARRGEQPVAAWMDIPVRFSLRSER